MAKNHKNELLKTYIIINEVNTSTKSGGGTKTFDSTKNHCLDNVTLLTVWQLINTNNCF